MVYGKNHDNSDSDYFEVDSTESVWYTFFYFSRHFFLF